MEWIQIFRTESLETVPRRGDPEGQDCIGRDKGTRIMVQEEGGIPLELAIFWGTLNFIGCTK
jgi:hypothetical protein